MDLVADSDLGEYDIFVTSKYKNIEGEQTIHTPEEGLTFKLNVLDPCATATISGPEPEPTSFSFNIGDNSVTLDYEFTLKPVIEAGPNVLTHFQINDDACKAYEPLTIVSEFNEL